MEPEESESERVFHHHHTYDVDQSEVVSVSALNTLGCEDDFQYARLVQKLQKKHECRRKNIKVLRLVITNKLNAERQIRHALASSETHSDADEDSLAAVDGEHADAASGRRRAAPSKDLVELLAGGSMVEVEERITRFQQMLTRVQELEAEIQTQARALPKLAKDIQKRENKLKVSLDKIKRKSHDIREDFRSVREKTRLRKRIEALKLEGKYFEVNQLERLNRDRKQTVANMLPELEKRENDLKELICRSSSGLRAQADEYDEAAKYITTSPPPVVPRHCYTSDFLENGHPRADDGTSIGGQTETDDTTEGETDETSSSAIWDETTTNDDDDDDRASVSVASSDTLEPAAAAVVMSNKSNKRRITLDTLRQVRGRNKHAHRSSSQPMAHRNLQDPESMHHDLRPCRKPLHTNHSGQHASTPQTRPIADENDSSRMNTAFIEAEEEDDGEARTAEHNMCRRRRPQPPPRPVSATTTTGTGGGGRSHHQADESKHDEDDDGGMHSHLPPHLRAQAHLQQQQQQHAAADYGDCTSPRPQRVNFHQTIVVRTPSRSRSRKCDETLSPVQEQDEEFHIATTVSSRGAEQ